jgi:hypothetical protein
MVFAPALNLLAATPMLATPFVGARFALPSTVFPNVKLTAPAGNAEPLGTFTVAEIVVDSVGAMLAGPAATVIAVATIGGVIVTVTEPLDPLNLLSPG